jgi:hypothetical protein
MPALIISMMNRLKAGKSIFLPFSIKQIPQFIKLSK